MRKISVLATLAAVINGCAPPPAPISYSPPVQTGPKYEANCYGDKKNAFGERDGRKHCKVYVTDFQFKDANGNSGPVYDDIVEVNSGGVTVGAVYFRSTGCPFPPPFKKAVDGKRIDGLPAAQIIAAMKVGTVFSYETTNTGYPGCIAYPTRTQSVRLTGFGAAYDEMMARWSKM